MNFGVNNNDLDSTGNFERVSALRKSRVQRGQSQDGGNRSQSNVRSDFRNETTEFLMDTEVYGPLKDVNFGQDLY